VIGILSSVKILDAINKLLVKAYLDYTVYIDLCPKNFERPSFLIEMITAERNPVNRKTIHETDFFTITVFDVKDDYGNSSTTGLLNLQQGVLDIFKPGYICVDGRAVKVKASSGGRNFGEAYIDIQVEYFEDCSDTADTIPLMKEVITTVKEE
jgi:hypothetical protein